jgi:nitroreductase
MNNTAIAPEQVIEQLKWRYAVKKFDPSLKISDRVWNVLEDSLVLAPSSFGLQPWKFIVVRNPEVRQNLVAHSWGQTQVAEASHLVVLAIKKDLNDADVDRYVARMSEVQNVPVENLQKFAGVVKGFIKQPPYPLNLNEWSTRQVYLALGQYMTAAAMLGIDTCPMEGFSPTKYDEVLGLTDSEYTTVVVCPAGYRAADDKYASSPKVRFSKENVVHYID